MEGRTPIEESPVRRIALLVALLALPTIPLAAQLNNTGGSGWSVNVFTVSSGTWSGFYGAYVPVGGHPGEWEDNTASTQWISAWDDFSTTPGAGDYVHTTDANARYHYLFRYDFGGIAGGGSMNFTAGWDNILKGFQFSNGGFLSPPSSYALGSTDRPLDNHFGFCRNGDAMNNTGDAVCTSQFSVPVAAGATWMQFSVWGDGQTDGFWMEWDQAGVPTETVPEPATMTLLATGLAGIAGKSLRRRKKHAEE
jgi:hypothetical protein